jgi:hypothetical protein
MFANLSLSKGLVMVLLAAALGMTACGGSSVQKTNESASAVQEPDHYEHTVRWPGESLAIIAKWYTGKAKNWSLLADENPDVTPNKLKIGTVIKVPRELVVNTEPMPRSAIPQASKSKRAPGAKGVSPRRSAPQVEQGGEAEAAETRSAPAQQPQKGQKEDLDLFGPKE